MSLRTRLILAFFLLSVVPLAAVTIYTYSTNVNALRDAAEREADLLAGELGQRMQLVTAQLSERVEHLMDIAELQAAADAAAQVEQVAEAAVGSTAPPAASAAPASRTTLMKVTDPALLGDQIAKQLGETAMLLNNVRLQNVRGGGGGRGGGRGGQPPPPGVVPPPPPVATVGRAIPTAPAPPVPSSATKPVASSTTAPRTSSAVTSTATPTPTGTPTATPTTTQPPTTMVGRANEPSRGRGPRPGDRGFDSGRQGGGGAGQRGAPPEARPQPGGAGAPGGSAQVATITPTKDANGNLMIDMGPLRRELFQQVLPAGKRFEELTPEERQRIAAEVNQRLLGIQQGLQIGAAELQKRAVEAEQAAAAKAAEVKAAPALAAKATAKTPPPAEIKRRSSVSGSQIAVNIERDGEVVRSLNAEINVPNLMATVFSNTRRDRGEVPFAVAKDGTLHTRTAADKERVAALGDVAKPGGPAVSRNNDWIVVTTEDKSGSGFRLGIARPVGDSLANLRRAAARNAGFDLLFIALALAGIVPLSSRLTRNLSTLSEAVGRIAHGDYRARVPVKSNDEVGQLARAFNQMATDVERHQHTAVEQERLRRELELGRQIQNEMLPHAPLTLGLTQVQGISVPAREVGGDFFNYFVLDNGQIALLMGDVSGKGVGAALLMANIQASLKIRLDLGQNLAAVADALDRDIESNSPGPVYATLFIGMLDPATRRLRYVNAGHNPQYVLRSQGGLERMAATGLPVGLLAGRGYTEHHIQLAAGDLLVFYTDGCVEAENERGEMFGMERLDALLLDAVGSADPLHRIEKALMDYRGKSEPSDDATLMTVKVG